MTTAKKRLEVYFSQKLNQKFWKRLLSYIGKYYFGKKILYSDLRKVFKLTRSLKSYWKWKYFFQVFFVPIFEKLFLYHHDRTLCIEPVARWDGPDRVWVPRDDDVDLVHHRHLRHPQLTLGLPPPLPPLSGSSWFPSSTL